MKKKDLIKLLEPLNDNDSIVLISPYMEGSVPDNNGLEEDYEENLTIEERTVWEVAVPIKYKRLFSDDTVSYLIDVASYSDKSLTELVEKANGIMEKRKVFCIS